MHEGEDGFVRCSSCEWGIDLTVGEHYHVTGVRGRGPICCACWRKEHWLPYCVIALIADRDGRRLGRV
jgi:hypothetical protein